MSDKPDLNPDAFFEWATAHLRARRGDSLARAARAAAHAAAKSPGARVDAERNARTDEAPAAPGTAQFVRVDRIGERVAIATKKGA